MKGMGERKEKERKRGKHKPEQKREKGGFLCFFSGIHEEEGYVTHFLFINGLKSEQNVP